MTNSEMKPLIEAILFTMGEAVAITRIAEALESPEMQVRVVLEDLMKEYEAEGRGIEIIRVNDSFQMCTKKKAYEYLIKLVQLPKNYRLTDVQLETLSIIAYKQPITKADIEKIRGVNADHAVNRLIEAGLVEESGRLSTPGRPILFVTTNEFLRRFGLSDTDDLPDINAEKVETFKIEAENEIGFHPEPEESVIITG